MLEALSRGAFDLEIARLDKRVVERRNWTVVTAEFPVLDVVFNHPVRAPLRLRFTCQGWDDEPPSIEILTEGGEPILSYRDPSHAHDYVFAGGLSIYNSGPHEQTGRPFICMRGSREFHIHSGHRNETWDNYRGRSGNDLLGLLDQLWRVWKKAAQ